MKNYLTFKHLPRSLKLLLLLSIIFGINNCKRDMDGPCDKSDIYYDTSYFEKNERDLLPDWEGDSLFFYSDAGDTAYLYCEIQELLISKNWGESGDATCRWNIYQPYEKFLAIYRSNNPELNNLQIEIYKESYSKSDQSNPPIRQALIRSPKVGNYTLFDFDGKTLPNDSVSLANGQIEVGRISGEDVTMNLKVGILKIKRYSDSKKWTLYRYTLTN